MLDNIPTELQRLPRWVCALKDSKMPMKCYAYEPASASSSATWSPFVYAKEAVAQGYYPYAGFVFADDGYVGIDIDQGYDEDGFLSPMAVDIIRKCDSYTERSKSGRGFHIILKGDLPFLGKNNQAGVEIYKAGRYFIMTGDVMGDGDIRENQEAIDQIVDTYFPQTMRAGNGQATDRVYTPVWQVNPGKIPLRPYYPPIPQGARNLSLASIGGSLHRQGYTKDQIFHELMIANDRACQPPLPKWEVKMIASSVCKYERT